MIEIPNFKTLEITHIVCDYNGTIAKDGIVLPAIKPLFAQLCKRYTLHVITADTFGSVHAQLEGYNTQIKVLSSDDHTKEKADYITQLGSEGCGAMGNGNNDSEMLKTAAIGIAVLGDEGCSKDALINADMICQNSADALALFLETKRLIATLRR
ncbi:MAG: haloacid dehalogenase [Helicobacteraceae bacterium]|jgi:soluble P-type ATPase|nr:haloacid dehalogenase [Helicobacteraceae bacterium]